MNEEVEKTSLMDKYIKIHLGGAAYRVRLMTLLLFAAAAILLIAAILILAFSGSSRMEYPLIITSPSDGARYPAII